MIVKHFRIAIFGGLNIAATVGPGIDYWGGGGGGGGGHCSLHKGVFVGDHTNHVKLTISMAIEIFVYMWAHARRKWMCMLNFNPDHIPVSY